MGAFSEATVNRHPAQSPNSAGGRFAPQDHTAPDSRLNPQVTVDLAGGHTATLTPGVLDDAAVTALTEGQCVAFAVAVAEHTGANRITALVHPTESRILHAWCPDPDDPDMMIDATGRQNQEDYLDEWASWCQACPACDEQQYTRCSEYVDVESGLEIKTMTLDEARQINSSPLGAGLPPQAWVLASSFVEPALAAPADDWWVLPRT